MEKLIKKFIPAFLLSWYHWSLAWLGAVLYRFPSKKLKVIGVTGTKGKSTVVQLMAEILEEAGFKTASLSSIRFKIGHEERPNLFKMTMPGRLQIQKFLRRAVKESCQYAILEVTSEGIRQHRHQFIDFDVAVFTNLAPEHIESHGSFEKYRDAKGKLFQATKNIHIINLDDPHADYFWQFPAKTKIGYKKQDFEKFQPLNLKLPGEFNIYNALAAIYFALSQGIDLKTCQRALEKVEGIPGRMELVIKEPFRVIVDYAHTPDALEKVYKTINGRKICVLGSAGGGRDRWKRPKMGEIASKYCDEIILTNEDPYDENPSQILSQMKSGIPDTKYQILDTILNRREAIKKALNLAGPGDTVIITGKGCEPWMCIAHGKKIPWDDRQIVREEFDKLKR